MAKRGRGNDRQLVELHRGSHLSQSALANVLRNIRDNGLPTASSRQTQQRAHEALASTLTQYGPLYQEVMFPLKKLFSCPAQAPMPMLAYMIDQCTTVRALLRRLLGGQPCSADSMWRLVIYIDGISPQNPLAKGKDKRMVEAVYWSFMEFGQFLCMEEFWFCCAATRTCMVQELPAKGSQYLSIILSELFFNSDKCDFARHGMVLDLSENRDKSNLHTLMAKHFMTIGDEKALSEILTSKGHSGTKPCAMCRNLVDHRTDYSVHDITGTLLPLTNLQLHKWRLHSDDSVREVMRRLQDLEAARAAGAISQAYLNQATQIHGWNFHTQGLIMNAQLAYKPISTLSFDWMHIWAVDGLVNREVHALQEVKPTGFTGPLLNAYLARWSWPKAVASGKTVFETGKFSATASQTLSCMPVLSRYVREVVQPSGELRDQVSSFLLCADTLEMLNGAARGVGTPARLEASTIEFLKAHQKAYGERWWVFKHHMSVHIPHMWQAFGGLLNCWVHERKHRQVKRFVLNKLHTHAYERGMMQSLIAQCLYDMQHVTLGLGLIEARSASKTLLETIRSMRPGIRHVQSSIQARIQQGSVVTRADVVLLGHEYAQAAGEVWFHLECDAGLETASGPLTLMVIHPLLRQCPRNRWSEHTVQDKLVLIPTMHIKTAVVCRWGEQILTTLWPLTNA